MSTQGREGWVGEGLAEITQSTRLLSDSRWRHGLGEEVRVGVRAASLSFLWSLQRASAWRAQATP